MISVEERAIRYVHRMRPAIQGQRGSDAAFAAACGLVHGFKLSSETALRLFLDHYNPRCIPPWSDHEARHKIRSAQKASSRLPAGYLLKAPTETPTRTTITRRVASSSERTPKRQVQPLGVRELTPSECDVIARSRNLDGPGIRLASLLGLVRAGMWRRMQVWGVCNSRGKLPLLRRIDGKPILGRKAHCLVRGSEFHQPYGFITGWQGHAYALAEGMTDYLALWEQCVREQLKCDHAGTFSFNDLARVKRELKCIPLMLISASARIQKAMLPTFRGKRVRIFVDNDAAARRTAVCSARTLKGEATKVDVFDCRDWLNRDGADFNDCYPVISERVLPL